MSSPASSSARNPAEEDKNREQNPGGFGVYDGGRWNCYGGFDYGGKSQHAAPEYSHGWTESTGSNRLSLSTAGYRLATGGATNETQNTKAHRAPNKVAYYIRQDSRAGTRAAVTDSMTNARAGSMYGGISSSSISSSSRSSINMSGNAVPYPPKLPTMPNLSGMPNVHTAGVPSVAVQGLNLGSEHWVDILVHYGIGFALLPRRCCYQIFSLAIALLLRGTLSSCVGFGNDRSIAEVDFTLVIARTRP
ncbi:hypothetical protein NUW58_g6822 [Xylaria curta]|uniref:Uncharacterized protein n=1 Tax=Xylaria curta TaxID=42375 RepID=A0ACC1NNQ9_9PEZI|nr:hypothetical protein NUW58_g6822 [Xylaria curta]